jgi:hypothetical protein
MTKTLHFNNGEPQIAKSDGKMQPVIISDKDKICGPCWDCFWAPCSDVMGSKYVNHIRRIIVDQFLRLNDFLSILLCAHK